jgi:hypothetical protein
MKIISLLGNELPEIIFACCKRLTNGSFHLDLEAVELVKRARQETTRYAGEGKGLDPNQITFPTRM